MIRNGKKFLDDQYREKTEEIDPEGVTKTTLGWGCVDFHFHSRFSGRSKTVRARSATVTDNWDHEPDGFLSFWHDGKKYGYRPEEVLLVSLEGDSPLTLAQGDEIYRVESVSFPQRPEVAGAVQEDVEATVYYWSDRSDELQDVTIKVRSVRENTDDPWIIGGRDVSDTGRRIEAAVREEREITASGVGRNEVTLGKVARVEFPEGHRYTVDIRGLPDDRARDAVERIKNRLTKRRGYNDVEVTHEGRIPEE